MTADRARARRYLSAAARHGSSARLPVRGARWIAALAWASCVSAQAVPPITGGTAHVAAANGGAATVAGVAAGGATATSTPPSGNGGDWDSLRSFVERSVGPAARVEVKFGELDPRLQLAPCARIEPFLPSGARLWGRSYVGLRCTQGASWSVSLPVTVSVWGPSLVAASTLAAGAAPAPTDFRVDMVELTRESGQLVADPALLGGRVMSRPIAAGQPLRADHLRVPPTVTAGDPVKVRLVGEGFSIATDGVALSSAGDGQALRVKMESGKIVTGTVRDRSVEIRL